MVKKGSQVKDEATVACGIRQQEALSAMLHWLKRVSRIEVAPEGNVFRGPISIHIEFKSRRHTTEFLGIMESMTCITLKKESLLQVDIEVNLKKLAEETA
ncbi:MAG: hypothetical protein CO141_02635 [Candidatus Moranbacteria bacterium CG_4_9_14_3_um_filter_42_9]|nr:MAG: hypothetical protein CO141_02635 [Candidatus Moranbacteria bacterium CG_4_9_14_3_um_filter_42_9]